jgi:predicted  nucleic acid-binding Zn-ribbon protein
MVNLNISVKERTNMPRGVRKTALEKLQEELMEVQESIKQYKESLVTLDEKEKEIQDKIKLEQFKEVSSILDEHEMSIMDLKELLISSKAD